MTDVKGNPSGLRTAVPRPRASSLASRFPRVSPRGQLTETPQTFLAEPVRFVLRVTVRGRRSHLRRLKKEKETRGFGRCDLLRSSEVDEGCRAGPGRRPDAGPRSRERAGVTRGPAARPGSLGRRRWLRRRPRPHTHWNPRGTRSQCGKQHLEIFRRDEIVL